MMNAKGWRIRIRPRGRYLLPVLMLVLSVAILPGWASADERNQAGLVILSDDGQAVTFCIEFEQDEITGEELLARSNLPVISDSATALGVRVCQIQDTGCAYPVEHCFCQCMGGGECAYWNYFYRNPDEPTWTYSPLGAAMRRIKPGSVEGWVWGDGRTAPADDLSFEAICLPPTPTPTAEPKTAVHTATPEIAVTATETTSVPPTNTPRSRETVVTAPTATIPSPMPTLAPSPAVDDGASLASYWPFGLMVVCLLAAGVMVWLRRA